MTHRLHHLTVAAVVVVVAWQLESTAACSTLVTTMTVQRSSFGCVKYAGNESTPHSVGGRAGFYGRAAARTVNDNQSCRYTKAAFNTNGTVIVLNNVKGFFLTN